MSIPTLPLDIYHLIKFFLPPQDLLTHTNLSNSSAWIRNELYPSDESWKPLLQASGLSRSIHNLQGKRTEGRRWRSVVLDLIAHERRGCSAEVVVGVDPGSEGVLGETYWEGLCVCTGRRMLSFHDSSVSLSPLTPRQVEQDNIELTLNDNLKLSFPSFARLLTLDDQVVRTRVEASKMSEPWGNLIRVSEHPMVAYSFASSPPVTEMMFWFGHTRVSNPDGVTVWDVRQAFVKSSILTSVSRSEDGVTTRGADTWLEGALGVHLPPNERTYLLGRDGWEQEKKGSVRIGHGSLWDVSEPAVVNA